MCRHPRDQHVDALCSRIELALAGYGHLAILERLGINYNTVRSRYNRGLAQLQRMLAGSR